MQTKIARFTETVVSLAQKAVAGDPGPAYRSGKDGYADWVVLAVQGLKEYLGQVYRKLLDVLKEMPRVTKSLGLTPETVPHFSTVCTRKQEIPMKRWRAILDSSIELYDLGDVQAIDATDVDHVQASQHYAKRTEYTFEAVKTSVLIDCETSAILDRHCSMKQPHDTQIGWQVLVRNLDELTAVAADKGYDWENLRTKLRSEGVTPLIPQRAPGMRGWARDVLIYDRVYHLRSNSESVFFELRRRYGETPWSRTRFGKFRELVMKSAVRNIERAIEDSTR
ncbi:IS5 family transposase [Natronosalvus caseinilyticus]|uniref:IS5 family transposase n=1 Tax=Natronosalvus caseinilyticus TaxID=2953747 RepID=UPI0028AED9EF|nr:IS5 family transposase [Natronosalvus caseinilyticus]